MHVSLAPQESKDESWDCDITTSSSMFFQMTMSVTLGVFIYEGTAYNLPLGARIETSRAETRLSGAVRRHQGLLAPDFHWVVCRHVHAARAMNRAKQGCCQSLHPWLILA